MITDHVPVAEVERRVPELEPVRERPEKRNARRRNARAFSRHGCQSDFVQRAHAAALHICKSAGGGSAPLGLKPVRSGGGGHEGTAGWTGGVSSSAV